MRISTGNGGWSRLDGVEGLPGRVYVRVQEVDGLLRLTELYVDGRGDPLSGGGLRKFPLQAIERLAAGRVTESGRALAVGPNLSRLAAFFATTFGPKAKHWVADSMRAQYDPGVVDPAEPEVSFKTAEPPAAVAIDAPPGGRLTDEWLADLARAYRVSIARRESPAKSIAAALGPGTSVRTVQGWIAKARDRGILEPAARTGRIV